MFLYVFLFDLEFVVLRAEFANCLLDDFQLEILKEVWRNKNHKSMILEVD
jgi:hypothetical protein